MKASSGPYDVRIEVGLLDRQVAGGAYRAAITDARFADRAGDIPVVAVEATESKKTLSTVEDVIVELFRAGVHRGDHVLAVGGGMLQDVATLAASLFMRGLEWTYAPTTLMAMADSCLGGKSSINAGPLKNLVGNIYPPAEVLVDPGFIRTLRQVDLVSGLAEAAKICFCHGPDAFSAYCEVLPSPVAPEADFESLVATSLRAKQWFVEVDEHDRAERRLLNFGHTFGHALEAATAFRAPHGVAVALGMLAASRFVEGADAEAADPLCRHVLDLLQSLDQASELVSAVDWERFRLTFAGDKKHAVGAYRLVLPIAGGGVAVCDLPAVPETIDRAVVAMRAALDEVAGGTRVT